jgi:hypothetical protein
LVRKDLPRSAQIVQACHATLEAGLHLVSPEIEHPHFVLLGVDDQHALIKALSLIQSKQIPFVQFREADLGDELTAVAAGPVYGSDRSVFKRFQILKESHCAIGN